MSLITHDHGDGRVVIHTSDKPCLTCKKEAKTPKPSLLEGSYVPAGGRRFA